jgi:hypothetical protein
LYGIVEFAPDFHPFHWKKEKGKNKNNSALPKIG